MNTNKHAVYRPTDYMYSSALARAKEVRLVGKEALSRLIDAPSEENAIALLAEHGYVPPTRVLPSPRELDDMLDRTLAELFNELEQALPSFDGVPVSALTALRYPYDCNNVKTAIKCGEAGVSTDGLLFDVGAVSADDTLALVSGKMEMEDVKANGGSRACGLPTHMTAAIDTAKEAYAATKNPRMIDLILDRACYEDMLEAAEAMGIPFLHEYVRTRIDCTNILTTLRLLRMYPSDKARLSDLMDKAVLGGGSITPNTLISVIEGGREALLDIIKREARFERYADTVCSEDTSLSAAELVLDNVIGDFIAGAKPIASGAEVPVGYLLALEISIKNVRIVLAGRRAGLDRAVIRERLRESYGA